jgi:pyruvate dehydrogenase E1 component alpha subunit
MSNALMSDLYERTLTIRRFEEAARAQYRLGNIRGYLHLYLGEEAVAVGSIAALEADDFIVSTHRGHGHAIAKGHDPRIMMAELFGKETGYCRGRGGSMHVSNLAQHNLGANGIVGGGIPIATGAAMGLKRRGSRQIVLSFFSDGATNNGVFHESLNMAAIYGLPVVYVLENNHYAVSTPVETSTKIGDLSTRAASYGMPGLTVDGNDAVAVLQAMQEPVARARRGDGPSLVECSTYRQSGHHVNDPGLYMPKEQLDAWKSRDPVLVLQNHLRSAGVSDDKIAEIDARVESTIEEAVTFAAQSPQPAVETFLQELVDA